MRIKNVWKKGIVLLALLILLPLYGQEGPDDDEDPDAGGRRITIRFRPRYRYPTYKTFRIHPFGAVMSRDYNFYNIVMNYDYFNGNKSMVHLTLGYSPSENTSGADAKGFTAGFLYGIVSSKKHYSDGALAFSWDIGAYINKIDIDGRAWGHDYTGGMDNYEFHIGPRGDFFLRVLGKNPSLIDLWMSTYFHLIAGHRKFERFEDGSLDASTDGANLGFSWGFILTGALVSVDMELGSFGEFFFRVGIGLNFNL